MYVCVCIYEKGDVLTQDKTTWEGCLNSVFPEKDNSAKKVAMLS